MSGCARPDKWCTNERKDILKMLEISGGTWQQCGRVCTDSLGCGYWSFDGYRCYLFKEETTCHMGENTAKPNSIAYYHTYQGEKNCPNGMNFNSN